MTTQQIAEKEKELRNLRHEIFHCDDEEEQNEISEKIEAIKNSLMPHWNRESNKIKSDFYLRAYQ